MINARAERIHRETDSKLTDTSDLHWHAQDLHQRRIFLSVCTLKLKLRVTTTRKSRCFEKHTASDKGLTFPSNQRNSFRLVEEAINECTKAFREKIVTKKYAGLQFALTLRKEAAVDPGTKGSPLENWSPGQRESVVVPLARVWVLNFLRGSILDPGCFNSSPRTGLDGFWIFRRTSIKTSTKVLQKQSRTITLPSGGPTSGSTGYQTARTIRL